MSCLSALYQASMPLRRGLSRTIYTSNKTVTVLNMLLQHTYFVNNLIKGRIITDIPRDQYSSFFSSHYNYVMNRFELNLI